MTALNGAAWPWLVGPFVDAWVRVHAPASAGVTASEVRHEARARFLEPLLAHWERVAPGHVGEVAAGNAPHVPGGCPFQAWSVGEALRAAETTLHA